jgi:hypothetical protein
MQMKNSYWRIQSIRLGNHLKFYTFALFTILLLGVFSFSMLCAMDSDKLPKPGLQQSYFWFDRDDKQTVWLNPHLLAEFDPGPEELSPVKLIYGTNALTRPESTNYVRFWQLDNITQESAVARIRASYPAVRLSPVFHISPSMSSTKFALPGNIIVTFKASWEPARIAQWVQSKGLEIVKKIEAPVPKYLLKTDPGFHTLETANALYQSGEVEKALPNWWVERTVR